LSFAGADDDLEDRPYAWVSQRVVDRHGGRWRVAMRVAVRDSRVILGEVRLFPDEEGEKSQTEGKKGRWSRALAAIPPWGLEARLLKQIRLGTVPAWVVAMLSRDALDPNESWRKISRVTNEFMLPGAGTVMPRPRPRRAAGRDDRFYAVLAKAYTDALAARDRHPVKTLAARRGESPAHIRDWLHEARERGLLSRGAPGVVGGQLLPRALALLRGRRAGGPSGKQKIERQQGAKKGRKR